MTTIEKIREKVEYGRKVQDSTTALMRDFLDEFKAKRMAIRNDRTLSEVGQNEQISKLQGEYEKKALLFAKEIKDEYANTLAEARNEAEKIVLSDIPAADDRTKKLFAAKMDELSARVLFATTPVAATAALSEIVEAAGEHPALAAETKSKFLQLSQTAVGLTSDQKETLQIRKNLGNMYDQLSQKAMGEDGRAAAEIISQADAMKESQIFNSLVVNALREVSTTVSTFANNPDEYFARENDDN